MNIQSSPSAISEIGAAAASVDGATVGREGATPGAGEAGLGRDGAAAGDGAAVAGRSGTASGFTGTLGANPFGCWNMRESPLQSATEPRAEKFCIAQLSRHE